MTDRPILFSGPMVRAILEGRKTQTRRVAKHQPAFENASFGGFYRAPGGSLQFRLGNGEKLLTQSTRFEVGDCLWVRECIAKQRPPMSPWPATQTLYRADGERDGVRWTPSIHMPRWASRLTLVVTDVRVQRVQGISEDDARAEGCGWRETGNPSDNYLLVGEPRPAFSRLWDSLNAKRDGGAYAWDANPWVVAVTFETHHCNIDKMEGGA